MHDIKAAGGIEALEALRARTHNESVQTAALEALVALQVRLPHIRFVSFLDMWPGSVMPCPCEHLAHCHAVCVICRRSQLCSLWCT